MIVTMQDYTITDRAPVLIGYEGENLSRNFTVKTFDDLSTIASIELLIGDVNCGAMTVDDSEITISLDAFMIGKAGYKKAQLVMLDDTGAIVMKSNQFDVLVGASNNPRYYAAGEKVKTLTVNIDGRTRQIILPAGFAVSVNGDVAVDHIAFKAPASYGDFDFGAAACRVDWTGVDGTSHTNICVEKDADGNWIWALPTALTRGGEGEISFSVSYIVTDATTGAVTADWNTGLVKFYHLESAKSDDAEEDVEEETTYDRLASAIAAVQSAQASVDDVNAILAGITSATPTVVETVADLNSLDTSKVKLAIVAADGYLHYYDGTAWKSGFAYGGLQEVIAARTDSDGVTYADLKTRLNTAEAQIKEDLSRYNAYDIFADKLTKNSGTSNGFTFTWDGDVCTVTGSATGYGVNILRTSVALSSDVIPGNTYYVKYTTTDANVRLRIIWKTSSNTDIRSDYFTGDTTVTVPSTARKWTISLFINNTVTLPNPVTVSDIALLNTRSNAELLSLINALPPDYFIARGMVADGTNLNTVKQPGYYVLSTGMTYTNSPLASGVAGILLVFPATANSIEQVVYSMGEPTAVKTYARSAILGNFSFNWKELSGEQIVNEYVSQHYENTYNITATPTITADTNNYLASTRDNTDRTGDIQTMLNTAGVCHLGPGKFVVTGIDIPDYSALIGSGDRTVVVLADSVTAGYAVKLNNYSTVYGLRINGGSTAQGTSSTVGTRHGILFEGTKQSGQTGGVTKKKSKIDKCTINNFSGGGIACTGTGVDLDSNLLISDCFVDHCGAGIYIPYYSEFHRISNCAFTYNYYGCVDNGGNNNFVNCDFSGNKVGILIDNSNNQSPNVSHGSFSNCSVNHSYSDAGVINEGTAIKLLKANLGEIFTGMQIFYGAIVLDDCVGIRFIGANVGSKVPITIMNSNVVTFSDCTFKENPTHADSTFTQSNNTALKFTDCYLRDGTVYNPMSA